MWPGLDAETCYAKRIKIEIDAREVWENKQTIMIVELDCDDLVDTADYRVIASFLVAG